MDKTKRIKELVELLNKASDAYYNNANPIMTDKEYDALFDELKALESETRLVLSNSPTQNVGYEVKSKLEKVKHPIPLKSLGKTKSVEDVSKFVANQNALFMLKADGLTVEHLYENGKLVQSSTRGDSITGEEITHCARTFINLPLEIPYKGRLRIAGEAIIKLDDFEKINSKLPEEDRYKTSRNLTSGSVRQLNAEVCKQRNVRFYAFNLLECDDFISDSKDEVFKWLQKQGFDVIIYANIYKLDDDIKYLEDTINQLQHVAKENYIPIDGIVATYDSVEYSKSKGETAHHPLHSLAYKFADEVEETILRDVEWQTTRTSSINPVAIFDTVIIDGTEVSRASLHNLSIIANLGLNISNRIGIVKRNLIIPHVEVNYDKNKNGILEIPKQCPACGGDTAIQQVKDSKVLICTNPNCSAKQLDRFVHFVKRNCMNINGLSEATLEKFINKGFLKTFVDIFHLDRYKNEIITMEGFGVKSYNRLIQSIENARNVELPNFIFALGINNIGLETAKLICKAFNYDEETILKWVMYNDLIKIDGIGDVVANSYMQGIKELDLSGVLDALRKEVNIIKHEQQSNNGISLEGKTFVITGSVEHFKNRNELKSKIESLNGKVTGSVTGNTNYLINNDSQSNSSKNKKAKELGVSIITEQEFLDMIGE